MTAMNHGLAIPELSLVALVGISGSGKSTFARRHFAATEVLSSDFCRGLVADDENDQEATRDAFDVLYYIAGKRLAAGRLTVVDATNVQADARRQVVETAREHAVLPVAIVLDMPQALCEQRNAARPDRRFGPRVLRRQHDQLRRSLRSLRREGFRHVWVLTSPEEADAAVVRRVRMRNDLRDETGPFDVIGDVHGCLDELTELLVLLGYQAERDQAGRVVQAAHPDGRTAVFLGDLVDRGPDTPGVLSLAMAMTTAGHALAVAGNHEAKLLRALRGRDVRTSHGLAESLAQLEAREAAEPGFRAAAERFIDGLVSHYVLDGGRLVVAHAGLKEAYHGRASGRVRSFALYGDTTGETDEFGLPVRYPWAEEYRGRAMVLYGHTPVPSAEWVNNTLCLDTGCVFGGRLTALRYPERELVSVPARRTYYEPARPLAAPPAAGTSSVAPATAPSAGASAAPSAGASAASRREPDVLDIGDVLGKRVVHTRHHGRITVAEANATAAIEVMSRFATDPRWLVYLPPTMSPVSGLDGVRLAPFQVLAAEKGAFHDRDHRWHLGFADRLAAADPDLLLPTRHVVADLTGAGAGAGDERRATAWWEELTGSGGEGMVVKPLANYVRGPRGLVQPGLKVRGAEYLRLIYGPDYTEPANLARLRDRGLGAKRSLAAREYALGLEALDRLVAGEPLWRVHECVFAVLALESEPIDPRL